MYSFNGIFSAWAAQWNHLDFEFTNAWVPPLEIPIVIDLGYHTGIWSFKISPGDVQLRLWSSEAPRKEENGEAREKHSYDSQPGCTLKSPKEL